jgi:aspartate/methionine/tyrosine aminotransferase
VTRPSYPNIFGAPVAIGCELSFLDTDFESGWRLDSDRIAAAIKPNTKLITVITPNNPTGIIPSDEELWRLAQLTREKGVYLIVDETSSELQHGGRVPSLTASLGSHVIGVSSISKPFGVPENWSLLDGNEE